MGSISAVLNDVFFAVVIVSHAFRAMALAPNLTKLHDAVSYGAVCLDGSPPAYQLDWGVKEGTNNWLLFLQGGYWCSTTEECQQASTDSSGVGSSTKMGNDEFTGILDNKPKFNPYFYNWTRVYIRYCDRSSFTGDKEEAPVDGLYYRGGRIFDYVIDHLLKLGMETASNVLLSGCSAGGVGVILHCDKFRKLLPPMTNVKCLSDSGFILTNVPGTSGLANTFAKVVQLHDSTWHLPSSCTSKMNASLCFYPVNIVPHIQTPIFLLNSGFDTIQIAGINLAPGAPHLCKYALRKECGADQLKNWINYRLTMLQALKDLGNSSTRGLFINSCHTHSQSQFQGKWHGDPDSTLDNTSIANAVGEWFFDRRPFHVIDEHKTPRQCVEDDSEPYPCNNFTWGHSHLCKSGNNELN